jgi:hypothetical protein
MSIVDAVTADIGPGEPMSYEVVLSDPSVFLEKACWFKLLQDDSKEMMHNKISQYLEPSKKRPTTKYRTIAHGGYFYQVLYSLAGDVLALLERKQQDFFPHLPASQKYMSNTIHFIGKVIAFH